MIPRAPSSTLVSAAVQYLLTKSLQKQSLRVLDLGTGSGCLLISTILKIQQQYHLQTSSPTSSISTLQSPRIEGVGIDIDPDCLKIASNNAIFHHVDHITTFIESSFSTFHTHSKLNESSFDVLLCNPPYLPPVHESITTLQFHDPVLSIYVQDPKQHYIEVIQTLQKRPELMKVGSKIIFEIGNRGWQSIVESIKIQLGSHGVIDDVLRDSWGGHRAIIITWKS